MELLFKAKFAFKSQKISQLLQGEHKHHAQPIIEFLFVFQVLIEGSP